ncbi:MAG: UDP-3-O-(3-hydroxymyristoyl)glucosamine N-acyltransferase [Verrucomicrobia bacterium]|nr:MAG: UDP-3-O-(3-hydroxymyristoyl)glucosamine N-acyltransferase [Verrucomicrobiota bacterium]TAE85882.1 MAG: UDP-3-O-(3-hydroxymyristoyl)glucosamine N-acyltransferase [Verrucomicrobiota bacterium]TAF27413.1 MAG: UDP-3-O-(3-hydroxymyristoyl)glucosamine N-acyltransferase [Verrucomicrobiota bacterium]TAF42474.1 MAG: UDP-3-O-(3-hydroxymyristoyl)glucosamine N-acyltransferase [Verrucomicrobiota bacterium]
MKLSELARLVDGDIVRGELDFLIDGIAALDEAGPSELSFLGNEKYRAQYLNTRAGVVIVPRGVSEGPLGCALIAAENPSYAFGLAVKHFVAAVARSFAPGIHPRAVVDESARFDAAKVRIHAGAVVMAGAEIGDGSEIGPNSVVGEGVRIGRDCLLHANVTVRERCILGDRVILQPGAVIGSDGYGYEVIDGHHVKIDQVGIVEIRDDVEVGANSAIDRARFGRTVIGEGTKIDNLVQVAHNVQLGKHCLLVSQSGIAGSSRTGDYVVVAAQAGVGGHVKIGAKSVLAARAGATADLEGGQTYGGMPARPFMDEQRSRAMVRQLPKLVERIKALESRSGSHA